MPVLARLGHASKPPVKEADDLDAIQHPLQPCQSDELVLVAAARPATIDPQQVAVDGRDGKALGGVGVALGVIQHLLVGPPTGSLHPRAQPVQAHRLADLGHLPKPVAQLVQGGDEGTVGLAIPQGGQRAKQQVQAVADLGLGDPHRPPGAPVRQPVKNDRGDGVQADLQRQWRGAALAGWARWQQVGQAIGQPGQHVCGQRRARAG
jgi:hypothetical protein